MPVHRPGFWTLMTENTDDCNFQVLRCNFAGKSRCFFLCLGGGERTKRAVQWEPFHIGSEFLNHAG